MCIYIIYYTIYCKYICLPVVFEPADFIHNGGKNAVVCETFIMKKQPFILEKRCSFFLADIGIFIDFLVLEKKKTKMCSVESLSLSFQL